GIRREDGIAEESGPAARAVCPRESARLGTCAAPINRREREEVRRLCPIPAPFINRSRRRRRANDSHLSQLLGAVHDRWARARTRRAHGALRGLRAFVAAAARALRLG